jgi:NAD-dependent dihydropyrimidine dehydrogenase PreA subunit
VNDAACVACGRCLQVCPVGVFDWSSSGRAQATNADACIRCGKCLQVCPAGAITVSA